MTHFSVVQREADVHFRHWSNEIVFIHSKNPNWRSKVGGRGIKLDGDRVIPGQGLKDAQLSTLQSVCWPGSIFRVKQREEENGMGKPSSRPVYPSVYQYRLSPVMALPPPAPCLVLNLLFILTFPYWQTNLAAASASQPWDKSPERIWLMDVVLKAVESGVSPNLDNGSVSINHNHH